VTSRFSINRIIIIHFPLRSHNILTPTLSGFNKTRQQQKIHDLQRRSELKVISARLVVGSFNECRTEMKGARQIFCWCAAREIPLSLPLNEEESGGINRG
jgi:hypothetical protein